MTSQTTDNLPTSTRAVVLASRPHGEPTSENFRFDDVALPELGDGQILVANHVMSVDPYMRGRMNDVKSYVPPFAVDEPLEGGAVGQVIASRSEKAPVGATVMHQQGWREHAVVGEKEARVVDTTIAPASAYLGVLGLTGLTAWAGLTTIAPVKEGDVVFVSGAAGAVGSVAGQIARKLGASRVIGSAGTPEKVRWLTEDLGFDAAFDYHDGPVSKSLRAAAPDGIDVYFDNVGGDHLEAAIFALNTYGRIAACGAISQYNETELQPGPRGMMQFIGKRLTMRGYIVSDHADQTREWITTAAGWLQEGSLTTEETYVDGLDAAPQAFLDLLAGANTGKMLVRLGDAAQG
ncbi:NADP-dependent oxidoreductase [Nocardioidaceae bacterium]|nr:NADP-dependent oxidoreductase [Nocardioidaceae bacterium]